MIAQTYDYEVVVDQWCGESDNNGKPLATDALVAMYAANNQDVSGSQCTMLAGDDELTETFHRVDPHTNDPSRDDNASHGVRLEPKDDCGGGNVKDSEAATHISVTDALAVLNLANGTNPADSEDCKMVIIDDCPQEGQSGYGAAGAECVLDLDNPVTSPAEDGKSSCVYSRKTLDVCDDFDGTSEPVCESTTNDRNQYCNWVPTPSPGTCVGKTPTVRACLAYQILANIDR